MTRPEERKEERQSEGLSAQTIATMPVVPEQGLVERMPFACAQGVESQALFLKPANIRGTKSCRYRVRTYAMDKRLSLVHARGSSELCQVSKALRLSPPHSIVACALLRTPHKESVSIVGLQKLVCPKQLPEVAQLGSCGLSGRAKRDTAVVCVVALRGGRRIR